MFSAMEPKGGRGENLSKDCRFNWSFELSGRTGVIAEYEFLKLEFLEKLEQPVTRANRKSIIPVYVREYNPFVQILLFYFLFLFFFC